MKKTILLFTLLFILKINAQSLLNNYNDIFNRYSISPPDVYNFEKYSLSSVNSYVGKPEIGIPIYSIKTGNIEYPLSLIYNAGGIKVDQLASNVGLGWNLTSSMITRTINQDNDFDNLGNLNQQLDYASYSVDDKNHDNLVNGDGKIGYFLHKERGGYMVSDTNKQVDFLPDVYKFFTNGFSTTFYFDDINTPIEMNPKGTKIQAIASKIRIPYNRKNTNNTLIYNFLTKDFFTIIITTPNGIKYTFSDCDYSTNQEFITSSLEHYSPPQISAWHITKIEDLINNKKIDFIYENTSSNPNLTDGFHNEYAQRSYEYIDIPNGSSNNYSTCDFYQDYQSNWLSYNHRVFKNARVDVQIKRLKQIVFDEGSLYFNYGNESTTNGVPRVDIFNGDYITQINVKDNNNVIIKSFNFNYDYFTSNYSANNTDEFNPDGFQNSYRYKRLKLLNFGEIGKPTYKFYYNESIKLPPVNSFSVDFLGYYNGSYDIPNESTLMNTNAHPTLYYYPNQFEKSLLPFSVPNVSPNLVIPGVFTRHANTNVNYPSAWTLNKIEYPTGGSSEYNYELNEFEVFGQNVKGGGIRIASQVLKDDNGNNRSINYSYLKENSNNTSGSLPSFPYFGHPTKRFFCVFLDYDNQCCDLPPLVTCSSIPIITNTTNWKLFDKGNLNQDITSGSYVEYSRVVKNEIGKGRIEQKFTSSSMLGFENKIRRLSRTIYGISFLQDVQTCVGDFVIGNSGISANIFTDNSYKRGKLIEENIYSESNQLLKKTSLSYLNNVISFKRRSLPLVHGYSNYGAPSSHNLMMIQKDYIKAQYLPVSKTDSIFDNFRNIKVENIYYTYNTNGFLKTTESTESNGAFLQTKYYYPDDSSMSNEPLRNDLITKNMVGVPLKIETYIGTEKISEQKTVFAKDATTNNLLLPKFVYAKKGTDANATLEKKITYDLYDDKGNILQYTQENGVSNVIIWGYNKTQPIAEIQNIAYSNITSYVTNLQSLSNADNDTCTTGTCNEQLLRNALNSLRTTLASNYPNTRITTYTYNPLIGVTSVTDAKSDVQYYIYDSFQRLIKVIDKDGKIVSEKEFNYKPQN